MAKKGLNITKKIVSGGQKNKTIKKSFYRQKAPQPSGFFLFLFFILFL